MGYQTARFLSFFALLGLSGCVFPSLTTEVATNLGKHLWETKDAPPKVESDWTLGGGKTKPQVHTAQTIQATPLEQVASVAPAPNRRDAGTNPYRASTGEWVGKYAGAYCQNDQKWHAKTGNRYKKNGRWFTPLKSSLGFTQVGAASWYGSGFNGRTTANGDCFDKTLLTAAHPTLPLPTLARVTNLTNGKTVDVLINDRGPYVGNRIIDLSEAAADAIDYKSSGLVTVRAEALDGTFHTASGAKKPFNAIKRRGGETTPTPVQLAQPTPPAPYAVPNLSAIEPAAGVSSYATLPQAVAVPTTTTQTSHFYQTPTIKRPYVQLGAFGEKSRAYSQLAGLQPQFPKAHVQPISRNGQVLYRLRIGPFANAQSAMHTAQNVKWLGYAQARVLHSE